MSLGKKLGSSYDEAKDKIKYRKISIQFEDASFDLKVRIPFKKEMEQIINKISSPSQEAVDKIYERLTATIKKSLLDNGEEFIEALNSEKEVIKVTDNDIILDGTSFRQVATLTAMWETRVEEYFHLLQSESGEPITESFEEINEEFPEQVTKTILEAIEQAVKPDYKTIKKN
jgi:hypothetical protein